MPVKPFFFAIAVIISYLRSLKIDAPYWKSKYEQLNADGTKRL